MREQPGRHFFFLCVCFSFCLSLDQPNYVYCMRILVLLEKMGLSTRFASPQTDHAHLPVRGLTQTDQMDTFGV
jgi:hypothetical protein